MSYLDNESGYLSMFNEVIANYDSISTTSLSLTTICTPIRVRTDCVIATYPKKPFKKLLKIRDKYPGDYRIVGVTMTKLNPDDYKLAPGESSIEYKYHRKLTETTSVNDQWDPETYPKTLLDIDSFVCIAPLHVLSMGHL